MSDGQLIMKKRCEGVRCVVLDVCVVCLEEEEGGRRKKREGARRKMRQMKL